MEDPLDPPSHGEEEWQRRGEKRRRGEHAYRRLRAIKPKKSRKAAGSARSPDAPLIGGGGRGASSTGPAGAPSTGPAGAPSTGGAGVLSIGGAGAPLIAAAGVPSIAGGAAPSPGKVLPVSESPGKVLPVSESPGKGLPVSKEPGIDDFLYRSPYMTLSDFEEVPPGSDESPLHTDELPPDSPDYY